MKIVRHTTENSYERFFCKSKYLTHIKILFCNLKHVKMNKIFSIYFTIQARFFSWLANWLTDPTLASQKLPSHPSANCSNQWTWLPEYQFKTFILGIFFYINDISLYLCLEESEKTKPLPNDQFRHFWCNCRLPLTNIDTFCVCNNHRHVSASTMLILKQIS